MDAARGMEFLHSASPPILHRDFKSLNLLVDRKWNLKVADFGLTALKGVEDRRLGSIFWTAPEVLRGEPYNEASDVYSYGIVLWEILTRRGMCSVEAPLLHLPFSSVCLSFLLSHVLFRVLFFLVFLLLCVPGS